jgi:stage V sporulation protein SpoVS
MMSSTSQPNAVNGAIVDAVTIANTKVLAEAPAMAMGSLSQTSGNSVAMAYQAATTLGVTKLFSQNK